MSVTVMICAVCNRVLDRYADAYGVRFQHAAQDEAPHMPQPVPMPPGYTGGRCDFCNADHPAWRLPARDFTLPAVPNHGSMGDWAACDKCAALIRADNWEALVDQSAGRAYQRLGTEVAETRRLFREFYRRLQVSITGPLEPIQ